MYCYRETKLDEKCGQSYLFLAPIPRITTQTITFDPSPLHYSKDGELSAKKYPPSKMAHNLYFCPVPQPVPSSPIAAAYPLLIKT